MAAQLIMDSLPGAMAQAWEVVGPYIIGGTLFYIAVSIISRALKH